MTVVPGTRIGAYEITSALGAGGMGEVYRARDVRLKRDVAVKVLPSSFALDRDRVARFEREAELLAALNHPNIAGIYGVEQADAMLALVMELVEGEDLSVRLARGPIPVDEALPIAREIAGALEAAHERGIVHRDLKPANVKVRPDGTVKVLDFGLAKAVDASAGPAGSSAGVDNPMNSPTITSPAMTHAGVILGTAAYMSPEQARGKPIDRRADIWAFGALLFEMLTGTRAFAGDDVPETLASVLRSEPDWSRLPADLPGSIGTLIRRCLEKDPRRRLPHMSVATFLLGDGSEPRTSLATSETPARADVRRVVLGVVAATVVGAAIASAATYWLIGRSRPVGPLPPIRFTIAAVTGGETWRITTDRPLSVSPNGRSLVYRASANGVPQLFVRSFDALEPRLLANTSLPRAPFFSPDGEWVGFFVGSELRKVRVSGGPPVTIARAPTPGGLVNGASWGDDDSIVFAIHDPTATTSLPGLMVVPAAGGEPRVLTTVDSSRGEARHSYPFVLPGSRGVLFKVQMTGRAPSEGRLVVLDRASGEQREVAPLASGGEYVNGHVVYADERGRMFAKPFDVSTLRATADEIPLPDSVHVPSVGQPLFSSALSGAMAFIPAAGHDDIGRALVWVNRQGQEEPIAAPLRTYAVARLSPDASQIALDIREQENDIWVWSLARGALTKLTRGATLDIAPLWAPDGRRIVWASTRDTTNPVLYWQAADGTGTPERLTREGMSQFPGSFTPDGRSLLFYRGGNITSSTIDRLQLQGEREPTTVIKGAGVLATPEVSPDGRWLAYSSDESGQAEVYVRPYPNVDDGRWQISSQGGTRPAWNPNGRELFFLDAAEHLSVASIAVNGNALAPGAPKRLLTTAYYPGFTSRGLMLRGYDVAPDGERFLMIKGNAAAEQSVVTVVLNWSPKP